MGFDDARKRAKAKRGVPDEKPTLLVGSPMRASFSRLQDVGVAKMPVERVREIPAYGISHLGLCIELYRIQMHGGLVCPHELPETAASWKPP